MTGPVDAPAVVLLHSSVCDRRMGDPQRGPLAEAGFRVVRADFRSCGQSPAADAPYSDHGDVLELLGQLGIRRASFVGSSYGVRISLRIAALHPERASRPALLCLARPGLSPDGPEMCARPICPPSSRAPSTANCPGRGTCRRWSARGRSPPCCSTSSGGRPGRTALEGGARGR